MLEQLLPLFSSRLIATEPRSAATWSPPRPLATLARSCSRSTPSSRWRAPRGERRLRLIDFFLGYRKTALAQGELMISVALAAPAPGPEQRFYKVSKRVLDDISTVARWLRARPSPGSRAHHRALRSLMAASPPRRSAQPEPRARGRQAVEPRHARLLLGRARLSRYPADRSRAAARPTGARWWGSCSRISSPKRHPIPPPCERAAMNLRESQPIAEAPLQYRGADARPRVPLHHESAEGHVTGRAQYVDDLAAKSRTWPTPGR